MAKINFTRSFGPNNIRNRNILYVILTVAVVAAVLWFLKGTNNENTDLPGPATENVASGTAQPDPAAPAQPLPAPLPKQSLTRQPLPAGKPALRSPPAATVQAPPVATISTPAAPSTALRPAAPSGQPLTTVNASLEATALITEALQDITAGKIISARDKLNKTLEMGLDPQTTEAVKNQMARLSEQWLFSKGHLPGDELTEIYEVQPNDLLAKIGPKFNIPHELLQRINNIKDPKKLQRGQKIKVIRGPFNAVISKSTFTMDLYLQKTYVKSYKVGLGIEGKDTPTGLWCVKPGGKLVKPTWTDPDTGRRYTESDPDYPLGSRWIALDGIDGAAKGRTGFAIHGTKDPQSIGTRSSKGCIRLFNGDAVEVYDLLCPIVSRVQIID